MDEPLSNLDAKLREHMRVELVRLHKQLGTTSIYVTHDQTEAMTMADKILLLDGGEIQQFGTPNEFYNTPANLFVARFIGSPTMNIFDGVYQNGRFVSDNGAIDIEPKDADKELLKAHEGKKIYLGIRPERLLAGNKENSFKGRIDVIEMLGKEQVLYVKLDDDKEVIISQPGHYKYEVDEIHDFEFDLDALHFFDGETTKRIN